MDVVLDLTLAYSHDAHRIQCGCQHVCYPPNEVQGTWCKSCDECTQYTLALAFFFGEKSTHFFEFPMVVLVCFEERNQPQFAPSCIAMGTRINASFLRAICARAGLEIFFTCGKSSSHVEVCPNCASDNGGNDQYDETLRASFEPCINAFAPHGEAILVGAIIGHTVRGAVFKGGGMVQPTTKNAQK